MIAETAERDLALKLLGFGAAVWPRPETPRPHRLCSYLFELASQFTAFYEVCPVLKAEDHAVRDSRLALCALTLRVLVRGLDLLGVRCRSGCSPGLPGNARTFPGCSQERRAGIPD